MDNQLASAITWELLDDLSDGVVIVDLDGSIVYSNSAASSLWQVCGFKKPLAFTNKSWSRLFSPPVQFERPCPNGQTLLIAAKRLNLPQEQYNQIILRLADSQRSAEITHSDIDANTLIQISNEPDFGKQMGLLVDGLQKTGWQRVMLSLRDEMFEPIQIISAGFTVEEEATLKQNLIPAAGWQVLFTGEQYDHFREGGCYFVPQHSEWSQQFLPQIVPDGNNQVNVYEWRRFDVVCAPLYNRQQKLIGIIGLDRPLNGRRPEKAAMQTIEVYAKFAASIIENSQLVLEALTRNQEFELLLEASNDLSTSLERSTVLATMSRHLLKAINAQECSIYQWQPTATALALIKQADNSANAPVNVDVTHPSFMRYLIQQQQPYFGRLADVYEDGELPILWSAQQTPFNLAVMPLVVAGETYGVVVLTQHSELPITEQEQRLLLALMNQGGTALETALIFEDTYERERFYGALGNVSLALNYTLDRRVVLDLICSESLRIFNVDGAYVWQYENGRFFASAAKGYAAEQFVNKQVSIEDGEAFVTQLAQSRQSTFVNRVQQATGIEIRLPHSDNVQALMGVLLEQEANLVGILVLIDTRNPDRFTDKDVTRATTFGVQVSIALQNAKLFEELRQLNEELDLRVANRTRELNEESNRVKILLRINTELSASLDQDRVLNKALGLVNEVVNATDGVILLVDHESGEFVFRAALSAERPVMPRGIPSGLMRDQGLAGWMLENRSPVIVNDTTADPRWVQRATSSDYHSVLGVPLISNEEVIGVLMLFHDEANAFTNQQLALVEAAAVQVANAINNASLYQLIFDQAEQLGSMLRTETIQKANLKAILESIADGVIVTNGRNEIEIANMPASNILDISRKQLIGKHISELLGVYGQFGDSWQQTIADWANNAGDLEQWTYLADQLTIEEKFVSVHLSPVLSEGNFFGTVSIFRDITKEVEVDRLKGEFVSTVSHELRTPMTSIKGYADLMLMGAAGKLTEPQSRYLQVIKNNADRLHMLVNDLLDISRIETGKTTLELRPLDILQIIEHVERHLQGRIQHEGKQMSFTTDVEPALPLVNADEARVTQILTNLIDNAFNYTPEAGEIIISVRASRNYVFVSVEDTGIGISEDNLNKIFDRFYRAEDAAVQKVSGTGLGLAIVKSLIEMHGGHLQVESTLKKGSTFTFNLPIVIEDSDPT